MSPTSEAIEPTTRAQPPAAAGPLTTIPTVYEVGPLDRALDILEELAKVEQIALVDLAAAVRLSKSTAFRHLKVLARRGYVIQDLETKKYALGYGVLQLGYHARRNLHLPKVAHAEMAQLAAEFNETVHLGALIGPEVVHIAVIPSTQSLKMASEIGERTMVHVSSLGKCLIAWEGPEMLDAVLAGPGLPRFSPHSITDREAFERELAQVREQGFALDDQESLVGLRCVGAPVRGVGSTVIGAVSLSGPVDRVSEARLPEITGRVMTAAAQISRRCGWTP
jgi:DNA-binding IclR family transcriptional regulator